MGLEVVAFKRLPMTYCLSVQRVDLQTEFQWQLSERGWSKNGTSRNLGLDKIPVKTSVAP